MVKHPATYSESIVSALSDLVEPEDGDVIFDPFAGTGKIHLLRELFDAYVFTVGLEIEPEWASMHEGTVCGSIFNPPFRPEFCDWIITSPTYGNRFADSHDAKDGSYRRGYTHDLGRKLHSENSGHMHWGPKYRSFHERAWDICYDLLADGGHFVLNISDHIRAGQRMYVTDWHIKTLMKLNFFFVDAIRVETPRLRRGSNAHARVAHEQVLVFKKL